MKKTRKPGKRNPQDLTGRNNRARKSEIAALKKRMDAMEAWHCNIRMALKAIAVGRKGK